MDTVATAVEPHKHFWLLVGKKDDRRWRNGHALARCRRCEAVTVVEYGVFPYGPCPHVVAADG